ncbi:hypothetical protein U9M48_041458, partial [Paspalum notatum var. saurae]
MHDYELERKTAFLHGELEEDIYMDQPEGFVVPGKEDLVCRLKKSLYGLKQSPRQWYKRFDSFMISQGFKRSPAVAWKSLDDGRLYLSQKGYIKRVLHRFNMHEAKPVSTPLAAHFRLSSTMCPQSDKDVEYMSKVPYSSAVGSLMYAMVCSRPDLSHALSVVSRYMANPGKEHWKAVQWIFRYLRGTANACLQFGNSKSGLVGYVDSDYAGDLDKRRSLTGYVFTIGGCACWKASLQATW